MNFLSKPVLSFHDNIVFVELEANITQDELENAIGTLKRGKSHGPDCVMNEFFIECKDFIVPIFR